MGLIRNVGTIGGLTAISRVFGFARDMLLARVLGAGGVADAWQLAFQLPNIFRRLFAEGAFASAFVPLFNQRMADDDPDRTAARRFADEVMAVLIPILIVFSALALIAMPWIMGLFASDALAADARRFDLGVTMARIAFPYLAFMSLATLFAAILNSLARFAAAAAAPVFLNLCLITALIAGGMLDGSEEAKRQTGLYLAIAVSVSGLVQLVWLWIWARRAHFRFTPVRPRLTPGVRQLGRLIVPAVFGAGVYQISRFIDLFFLSSLPDKSITFLAMADRLNQMPLGIIGIALGTAILPSLSRFIAQERPDEAARLQSNAVELAMLLTVPAAVALFITGSAMTRAFYTGGAWTAADSLATGSVVAMLVVGLPAYVLLKVLTPGFFAREDTRTPVYAACAALCLNVALNFVLVPRLGVAGLALAGSLSAWANCAMLYAILARHGWFRLTGQVAWRIARIMAAAAAMGVLLWWIEPMGAAWYVGNVVQRITAILALVGIGMACFFGLAFAFGVVNRQTIGQLRRRKV